MANCERKPLRIISLPFYDQLYTIIEPTELVKTEYFNGKQCAIEYFRIPHKYVQSLHYKSNAMMLPRNELQLRFVLIDCNNVEQIDQFPNNFYVELDQKPVQLSPFILSNKTILPVDITSYCQPIRCSISQPLHRLQISWSIEDDKRKWAISVSIVRHLNSNILLTRLCDNTNARLPAKITRKMVVQQSYHDNDIKMDGVRASICCPLGKVQMKIPIRSRNCKHLQCFDAHHFLMMNEQISSWKCPICSQSAKYSDLIIDGYFTEILASVRPTDIEIELLSNGDWKLVQCQMLVLIDDEDETDIQPLSIIAPAPTPAPKPAPTPAPLKLMTVLRNDDDDDESVIEQSDREDDDVIVIGDTSSNSSSIIWLDYLPTPTPTSCNEVDDRKLTMDIWTKQVDSVLPLQQKGVHPMATYKRWSE